MTDARQGGPNGWAPSLATGWRARRSPDEGSGLAEALGDRAAVLLFGAIGWPWLLKSLHGGSQAQRAALLAELGLPDAALPNLGSWRADVGFLRQIAGHILRLEPKTVVEFGAGASTVVAARALRLAGGGDLLSFDEHADFAADTQRRLESLGLNGAVRAAPLTVKSPDWPGRWYQPGTLPDRIDMLLLDGPHWALHPFVRGAADMLFDRLPVGGVVLLDDADRPGERIVARRWRARWPAMAFERQVAGSKGCLVGTRVR